MPTQHIATLLGATLLGATCRVRLATVLRHVATCWVLLAQIWNWSKLTQQHPTCRNTSQHGGQTHATCCVQQCCDMLRWHVAIVWLGLNKCMPFRNKSEGKKFAIPNPKRTTYVQMSRSLRIRLEPVIEYSKIPLSYHTKGADPLEIHYFEQSF